jgi:hypothetical protein
VFVVSSLEQGADPGERITSFIVFIEIVSMNCGPLEKPGCLDIRVPMKGSNDCSVKIFRQLVSSLRVETINSLTFFSLSVISDIIPRLMVENDFPIKESRSKNSSPKSGIYTSCDTDFKDNREP